MVGQHAVLNESVQHTRAFCRFETEQPPRLYGGDAQTRHLAELRVHPSSQSQLIGWRGTRIQ